MLKKIAIFFAIGIIIIVGISYMYLNYKATYNQAKIENIKFENYYDKEIYGGDLTTIINRAVNVNENNEIEKNENGKYIENNTNSINIEIKMIDDDTIYNMETLYSGGMNNFLNYYKSIKFKCVDIKYHESTKKIKYMLFEQITQ